MGHFPPHNKIVQVFVLVTECFIKQAKTGKITVALAMSPFQLLAI
jgi:hypothetical protein